MKKKILLSAYACEPEEGSEHGIGWGWINFLVKNNLANVLIISDTVSLKNINKSARNIKNVKLIKDEGTNIYDLFKYKNVIITSTSAKKIQDRVLNEKN